MRGRTGLSGCQPSLGRRHDRADDLPASAFDLLVGEPQHEKALRRQPGIPRRIVVDPLVVERPVGFDDQSMAEADEVGDISSEHHLSAEFQAF